MKNSLRDEDVDDDYAEGKNVYGGIPKNGNETENNRRSSVNPQAQNPNEFRVQTIGLVSEISKKDPIGPSF